MLIAEGFIDLHCHILPGLDDGADSIEEALRMLDVAHGDGVAGIVATPHILQGRYENSPEEIAEATATLLSRQSCCALYPGAELRVTRQLVDSVRRDELPLINGKTHLLLELPSGNVPPLEVMEKLIGNLLANGVVPLFAHPERNIVLRSSPTLMRLLISFGALFQVTAMSITNDLGSDIRYAVFSMLRSGLAHVVASDAHDSRKRPPVLSRAFAVVSREFGKKKAEELFVVNPGRIICGAAPAPGGVGQHLPREQRPEASAAWFQGTGTNLTASAQVV